MDKALDTAGVTEADMICAQNDQFRGTWGADFTIPGQIVQTRSVAEMPFVTQQAIMITVMKFKDFTEENDPLGVHDFGRFTVMNGEVETTLYWKIDLYDNDLTWGSPEPADPKQTRRVLTIMQPFEY